MKVSDLFVDIYKNFNVANQVERIKQLSRKELLLLLILAVDSFDEDDPFVTQNFECFEGELTTIYNSLPDLDGSSEIHDVDLVELGKLTNDKFTNDKFIDIRQIRDSKGNKLPDPLTEEEVTTKRREIGINTIITD